jgi:hypothetical protein
MILNRKITQAATKQHVLGIIRQKWNLQSISRRNILDLEIELVKPYANRLPENTASHPSRRKPSATPPRKIQHSNNDTIQK